MNELQTDTLIRAEKSAASGHLQLPEDWKEELRKFQANVTARPFLYLAIVPENGPHNISLNRGVASDAAPVHGEWFSGVDLQIFTSMIPPNCDRAMANIR
jgi:hypothetical protein